MAASGRISGKNLYMTFGGVAIHGDFTSASVNQEDDQIDVTAGAETFHYFLSLARANGSVDFEAFYDGSTETVWDALVPGASGTLIMAPKGTDSGNPTWTVNHALVHSRNSSIPFDNGLTISATFQLSAAITETTY